jgi:hypothetical protein
MTRSALSGIFLMAPRVRQKKWIDEKKMNKGCTCVFHRLCLCLCEMMAVAGSGCMENTR